MLIMKRTIAALSLVAALTILVPSIADADVYMHSPRGSNVTESFDKTGWTSLSSVEFAVAKGVTAPAGPGSPVARKADVSVTPANAVLVKLQSLADAPTLYADAVQGKVLPSVTIVKTHNVNGHEVPYLTIDLTNVVVSSADWTGGTSDKPSLNLELRYSQAVTHLARANTAAAVSKVPPTITWDVIQNATP
jgi:type VI protein secretion system component Hcp